MATPTFHQARLKLQWANHHFDRLHSIWEGFLKTEFYSIDVESYRDPAGELREVLRVALREPTPAELPLLIGDLVHSLRCALDYTINEILYGKSTRITFPAHETRDQLIASFRTEPENVGGKTLKIGSNAAIERAVSGFGAFITDTIKPYKGGNDILWAIGKLDNTDKHRLLMPILIPFGVSGLDVSSDLVIFEDICAPIIENGWIISVDVPASNLKVDKQGSITAEILLHEVGVVENQRALPFLAQMFHSTGKAIDMIEEFVIASGWRQAT